MSNLQFDIFQLMQTYNHIAGSKKIEQMILIKFIKIRSYYQMQQDNDQELTLMVMPDINQTIQITSVQKKTLPINSLKFFQINFKPCYSIKLRNFVLVYFVFLTFLYFIFGLSSNIQNVETTFINQMISPQTQAKIKFSKNSHDVQITSSQIKYRSTNFENFQKNFLQKLYLNDSKYLSDKIDVRTMQDQKIKIINQKIGDLARSSNFRLKNPENPPYLKRILAHQPLQLNQLPFCLFVRLSKNHTKQFNVKVVISVFNLNYTNYIINFYGDHPDFNDNQIKIIEGSQNKQSKRMYYYLRTSEPNYYQYRYIMHELCVEKSIVQFVSSVMNSQALQTMVNFHRAFPIYLTYSQNSTMYFVHSFQMRMFDLLFINDFYLTNQKYFGLANQQKLFALGLTEISQLFTKKLPIDIVYEKEFMKEVKLWMTANSITDNQVYSRIPYQPIFSLNQNYLINQKQIQNQILSVKKGQLSAENITEVNSQSLKSSLEQQQALYLPEEHLIYQKMYNQREKKYGRISRINKPNAEQFPKYPFCVVAIGKEEGNQTIEHKQRYIYSMLSILNQKYSNFHIVYIDDGLSEHTMSRILQKVKQSNILTGRFKYVKNQKKMSSTFNIVRAAFQFCQPNQMLVPIQSEILLTDPYFLNMINNIRAYNRDYWMIYTGYKIDKNKIGYTYRLRHDSQYKGYHQRLKGLRFLSPVPAIQVKVIRNIPLIYYQDKNGKWLQKCWLKSLQHSVAQLSTVWRIDYISQIEFSCPYSYVEEQIEQCAKSDVGQYLQKLPYLTLLNQQEIKNAKVEQEVQSALRSWLQKQNVKGYS